METYGYDYPLTQHLQAVQGTIELHLLSRKREGTETEETTGDDTAGKRNEAMDVEEDILPPTKRTARAGGWDKKHGWTNEHAAGIPVPEEPSGTATPQQLPSSDRKESDFPPLESATPPSTAQILKSLQADTRKALVEEQRASRTRLKGKQSAQGEPIKSAADAAMDALLRDLTPSGTPAQGTETGTLQGRSGSTSAKSEPSASGSSGSTDGRGLPPAVSASTAPVDAITSNTDMSEQKKVEESRDQFPGGDGEEDDV
jgi:hypothetical protein